jgi:hypothetical protein
MTLLFIQHNHHKTPIQLIRCSKKLQKEMELYLNLSPARLHSLIVRLIAWQPDNSRTELLRFICQHENSVPLPKQLSALPAIR